MGRYIGTSLYMSQDQQKPFTNHSWQVWRSIYNSHIDVKISPTMVWVHKEQAMLANAQSH